MVRGSAAIADLLLLTCLVSLASLALASAFQLPELEPEADVVARNMLLSLLVSDIPELRYEFQVSGFEMERKLEIGRTLAELVDELLFIKSRGQNTERFERVLQESISRFFRDFSGFGYSLSFCLDNLEDLQFEDRRGFHNLVWVENLSQPSLCYPGKTVQVSLGVWM